MRNRANSTFMMLKGSSHDYSSSMKSQTLLKRSKPFCVKVPQKDLTSPLITDEAYGRHSYQPNHDYKLSNKSVQGKFRIY